MRWLLLATVLLAGCTLYFGDPQPPPDTRPPNDPPPPPPTCSDPKPPGNCTCTSTIGWACTTCPFGETSEPVACTPPQDTSCQIETWEHGCYCSCTADGWWSCMPETVGSTCPHPPAPTGEVIEAESLASDAVGWTIAYGNVLHGGEGLSANYANRPFSFAFTGTGLVIAYEKGPNMGRYAVSIDGGAPVAVDAFQNYDFTFQNPTTVASNLAATLHTATVSCTSLYCEVDFFTVLGGAMQ